MKKNSFVEGTIIATVALVIVKIIGMLYVIPFYATIGVQGAALYAYAYNIYSLFLDISTAGVPTAVSKIVNEYNTLGKQEAKVRAFKIGKKLLGFVAIVAFILMFVFAKEFAVLIIGDISGGNTIEDVTFAIRCVSFALLVFPFLSVTRGFFQGHNAISVSSISQVIEQIVRVAIVLLGSYLAIKVFKQEIKIGVGIALFAAFLGGVSAYIYVSGKLKKHKHELCLDKEFTQKDDVSNKEIIKKIITYAIPVIIISGAYAIYNNVDMVLILKTMNHLGFEALDVEFIATAISTWSNKITVIVSTVSVGLSSSLVPHIVESNTLQDYGDINNKFNQALKIICYASLPMCIGISLLASPIWTVFYGFNQMGTNILAYGIFCPLFANLYATCNQTLQSMNKFKMVYISSISGILLNTLLDVPLMFLFNKIGLPAYWGASTATMIGFLLTFIIAAIYLKKAFNFNYSSFFKSLGKMIIPLVVMIGVVVLLKIIMPINYDSRFSCILYIAVIAIVGAFIYLFTSHKMGLIKDILGDNYLEKLKNKLFKKKKEA